MITLADWRSIPWQKRSALRAKFGIRQSGNTKVVDIISGVSVVEDDGVREGDLESVQSYTLETLIATLDGSSPVSAPEVPKESDEVVPQQPEAIKKKPKRGRKPKAK